MKNVIIDVDTGIDDALALMLAISSPELNIVGITTVSGNVEVEKATANTIKVLELMDSKIKVYPGAETPWKREHIPAYETHGDDGLGETFIEVKSFENKADLSASEFIIDSLNNFEDLSIIALGPLTNIFDALRLDSNAFRNLERFISMGGCYKSHGNCSPVAEYNYWVDPDAADYVFKNLPVKIEMVGLDVTRKIVLTPEMVNKLRDFPSKRQNFIESVTKFYMDFHMEYEGISGCVINDPLAVLYAFVPRLLEGFESYTEIVTEGIAIGQSIVDDHNFWKNKSNSIIMNKVEPDLFFNEFFKRVLDVDYSLIKKNCGEFDE